MHPGFSVSALSVNSIIHSEYKHNTLRNSFRLLDSTTFMLQCVCLFVWFFLCLCGHPPNFLVSSHQKHTSRCNGNAKLPLGVNDGVNVWMYTVL